MSFFQKIGHWFRRIMVGRYGVDQLNTFLIILSFCISLFPYLITNIITYILLIIIFWRMFSKKIYKRQKENLVFLRFWLPVKRFFKDLFRKQPDRKTHKYYRCPKCKQRVRVPRGKGKISITCPKCNTKFVKKT